MLLSWHSIKSSYYFINSYKSIFFKFCQFVYGFIVVLKFAYMATFFYSFHRPCHYMKTDLVFFITLKYFLNEERFFLQFHFAYKSTNFALNSPISKASTRPLTILVRIHTFLKATLFFSAQLQCCLSFNMNRD